MPTLPRKRATGNAAPEERQRTFAWIDKMKNVPTRYLRSGEKLLAEQIARRKPNAPNEGRTIANEFLAADIGQTVRNVKRLKLKLRRKGVIDYTDNAGGFVGGRGKASTYFLRDPASWFGQAGKGDNLSPFSDPERVTSRAAKGDELGTERVTTLSPTTTNHYQPLTARALPAPVGGAPVSRAPGSADRNGRDIFGKWSNGTTSEQPDINDEQPNEQQMEQNFASLLAEMRLRSREPR
jgi:hypothetical protein